MQHQRQWQVPFLCLVVFAAAVCGAKTPANTYADFVASKTGAAVQSESYQSEPREFEHTCLKEISLKNCMPLGVSDYFESGLACCDPRSQSGNSLGNSNIEVGSCKFTTNWFVNNPIAEAPGVSKYGEFSVQCYMNAASDTCGHPFCDQMVLSAAGGIYYAEDVVLTSRPIAPMLDGMCSGGGRKGSFPANMKGRKARGGDTKGPVSAKPANVADMSRPHTPTLYSGAAWIFFGPMSVNSRVHDVKVSQGWFEYVFDYEAALPITEYDAEGKHVIDPFTFALKFYKPASSY